VLNPDGSPAQVEVRLREQTLRAGELWTTRPRDGRFDRFLPVAGNYHVQLLREGVRLTEQPVRVGAERKQIEIVLPPLEQPAH
jgi:hypothetical protein